MCVMDAATREASVALFLREHPHLERPGRGHPALRGCAEVDWSRIPGCPAGTPALFRGLLDRNAAPEAKRLLTNVLMDGVFRMSPAMPAALPFLLRLAADPGVPVRSELLDVVLVAAELSQPVDADDERAVLLLGSEDERPERERCRAAFAGHASSLHALLDAATRDGLLSADDRAALLSAAGPH
ncbi:hypothetical protein C0036_00005 [Streptomyces sp. DJ]|nr:hypothetical protein C0036_00005 [Streptomyces sp. DJ]